MVASEERCGVLGPEDLSRDFRGTRAAYTYDADSCLANRGGYGGDGILVRIHVKHDPPAATLLRSYGIQYFLFKIPSSVTLKSYIA